jgi:3-oxoacyl-[acyl-carrier protein] reductase
MSEFEGKRVVVTGAAGIFGGWIARAFAASGARLCLSDLRQDALSARMAELGIDPAHTLLHGTELREPVSLVALAEMVAREWGARTSW